VIVCHHSLSSLHSSLSNIIGVRIIIYFDNLALARDFTFIYFIVCEVFIVNKIVIMDAILDSIPQLIKDIEQLEDFKAEKENERQLLESQNQKLRYRLKLLKEVSIICDITLLE